MDYQSTLQQQPPKQERPNQEALLSTPPPPQHHQLQRLPLSPPQFLGSSPLMNSNTASQQTPSVISVSSSSPYQFGMEQDQSVARRAGPTTSLYQRGSALAQSQQVVIIQHSQQESIMESPVGVGRGEGKKGATPKSRGGRKTPHNTPSLVPTTPSAETPQDDEIQIVVDKGSNSGRRGGSRSQRLDSILSNGAEMTAEELRMHKTRENERKRRMAQKSSAEKLRELVPGLNDGKARKAGEGIVMQKSAEYIEQLHQQLRVYRERDERLKQQVKQQQAQRQRQQMALQQRRQSLPEIIEHVEDPEITPELLEEIKMRHLEIFKCLLHNIHRLMKATNCISRMVGNAGYRMNAQMNGILKPDFDVPSSEKLENFLKAWANSLIVRKEPPSTANASQSGAVMTRPTSPGKPLQSPRVPGGVVARNPHAGFVPVTQALTSSSRQRQQLVMSMSNPENIRLHPLVPQPLRANFNPSQIEKFMHRGEVRLLQHRIIGPSSFSEAANIVDVAVDGQLSGYQLVPHRQQQFAHVNGQGLISCSSGSVRQFSQQQFSIGSMSGQPDGISRQMRNVTLRQEVDGGSRQDAGAGKVQEARGNRPNWSGGQVQPPAFPQLNVGFVKLEPFVEHMEQDGRVGVDLGIVKREMEQDQQQGIVSIAEVKREVHEGGMTNNLSGINDGDRPPDFLSIANVKREIEEEDDQHGHVSIADVKREEEEDEQISIVELEDEDCEQSVSVRLMNIKQEGLSDNDNESESPPPAQGKSDETSKKLYGWTVRGIGDRVPSSDEEENTSDDDDGMSGGGGCSIQVQNRPGAVVNMDRNMLEQVSDDDDDESHTSSPSSEVKTNVMMLRTELSQQDKVFRGMPLFKPDFVWHSLLENKDTMKEVEEICKATFEQVQEERVVMDKMLQAEMEEQQKNKRCKKDDGAKRGGKKRGRGRGRRR